MDLATLYQDIVETSPDGIWVIGLDGRTVYANPEIARIHRIPLGALGGIPDDELLDAVDESYRLVVGKLPRRARPDGWDAD